MSESPQKSFQIDGQPQPEQKRSSPLQNDFLRDGLSVEIIARGTGPSIEEVQQLQQQLNESSQASKVFAQSP